MAHAKHMGSFDKNSFVVMTSNLNFYMRPILQQLFVLLCVCVTSQPFKKKKKKKTVV